MNIKAQRLCAKWIKGSDEIPGLGFGFHPDTKGPDYVPAFTPQQAADYDSDMEALFGLDCDPYEEAIAVWRDMGLLKP